MAAENRRRGIFLSTARRHTGNHADRDGFQNADPEERRGKSCAGRQEVPCIPESLAVSGDVLWRLEGGIQAGCRC